MYEVDHGFLTFIESGRIVAQPATSSDLSVTRSRWCSVVCDVAIALVSAADTDGAMQGIRGVSRYRVNVNAPIQGGSTLGRRADRACGRDALRWTSGEQTAR
ncbi:MAG: hypothetical protein EBT22_08090, partial [Chloroflexi bacterium]|nr:hypothetical protein [Chloroflexota bacterium]